MGMEKRLELTFSSVLLMTNLQNLANYLKQVHQILDPEASLKGVDDTIVSGYDMFDYFEMKGFELERTLYGSLTRKETRALLDINVADLVSDEEDEIQVKKTYIKHFLQEKLNKSIFSSLILMLMLIKQERVFFSKSKDSLMNADLIEYEGHSGLGENLNLKVWK